MCVFDRRHSVYVAFSSSSVLLKLAFLTRAASFSKQLVVMTTAHEIGHAFGIKNSTIVDSFIRTGAAHDCCTPGYEVCTSNNECSLTDGSVCNPIDNKYIMYPTVTSGMHISCLACDPITQHSRFQLSPVLSLLQVTDSKHRSGLFDSLCCILPEIPQAKGLVPCRAESMFVWWRMLRRAHTATSCRCTVLNDTCISCFKGTVCRQAPPDNACQGAALCTGL